MYTRQEDQAAGGPPPGLPINVVTEPFGFSFFRTPLPPPGTVTLCPDALSNAETAIAVSVGRGLQLG